MSLQTITVALAGGGQTLQPIFFDSISFGGDDDYPAGGTPNFSEVVAAALGKTGIEVIGVMKAGPCGGYEVVYDKSADKLQVYEYDYDAVADGQAVENGTADISGTTFELVVLYV